MNNLEKKTLSKTLNLYDICKVIFYSKNAIEQGMRQVEVDY